MTLATFAARAHAIANVEAGELARAVIQIPDHPLVSAYV
jgi:hypothetical protein